MKTDKDYTFLLADAAIDYVRALRIYRDLSLVAAQRDRVISALDNLTHAETDLERAYDNLSASTRS